MVETDAWASGRSLASAGHPKRIARWVLAAQGEARMWEAPVVVARPAGGHLLAWETPEVQLVGGVVRPATRLGVGQMTEGALAPQLAGPMRSVAEVVDGRRGWERH